MGATFCFVTLDATMKQLANDYNVPFLVWARYLVQAVLMTLWLFPQRGLAILKTRNPRLQILRGVLLTLSSLSFFAALKYLPLAEAVALNYVAPLIVIGLATLFLGERMTIARWTMVVGCVAGMLMIVRPGSEALGFEAGFAILAAFFYGCFQVLTRHLADEDPMVTLFYPAVIGTAMLTVLLPLTWVEGAMPWRHMALIVLCGGLGTYGHYLFILAFRAAPASGLAPFTYMQLVWATLIGWLVFDNFPDLPALAGMAVIAASGLFLAWRERAPRPPRPPATADANRGER